MTLGLHFTENFLHSSGKINHSFITAFFTFVLPIQCFVPPTILPRGGDSRCHGGSIHHAHCAIHHVHFFKPFPCIEVIWVQIAKEVGFSPIQEDSVRYVVLFCITSFIVSSLTLPISTYQPFTVDSGNILVECCKLVFAFNGIYHFSLGIFK